MPSSPLQTQAQYKVGHLKPAANRQGTVEKYNGRGKMTPAVANGRIFGDTPKI
jgi:hypothetical protein